MRIAVLEKPGRLEREGHTLPGTQRSEARHVDIRVVDKTTAWDVRRREHSPALFGIELADYSDALHGFTLPLHDGA